MGRVISASYRACMLLAAFGFIAIWVTSAAAQSGSPGVDNSKGLSDNKISGQLYFPKGAERTPLRVRLTGDRGEVSTNSDNDGRFFFRGLRPGRYTLLVEGGALYQSVAQIVDVIPLGIPSSQGDNPSEIATLSIRLNARTDSTGSVNAGVVDVAATPKEALDRYNSALTLVQNGDRKKAIELLKEAIAIHPQFVAALNGLGVQYMKLGEFDRAAEAFSSALKINPDAFMLRLNYGLTLFQQKKYAEANQEFEHALKKNDGSATAHFYKGRSLIVLRRYDEAEVELRRTVELGAEEATLAHRYLAGLYIEKGDNARAISELETYLKLEPKAKEADKIRETIKSLQQKGSGQ